MMQYKLDYIKDKFEFENITYNSSEKRNYNLKHLYDSLSKIYQSFKYCLIAHDTKTGYGFHYICFFLKDSNTIYNLSVYIPDSLYIQSSYFNYWGYRNKFDKKLLNFDKFGVLAFIDKEVINELNEMYRKDPSYLDDDEFYQEYLQLLKKMYRKQKDKKSKK